MHVARFLLAVVLSGVISAFTDGLFMGALFHSKYLAFPEIWRIQAGQNDKRSIFLSSLLGLFAGAAFLFLCAATGAFSSYLAALRIALLVSLAGAIPIIFSNIVWIKMHPLLGVSHSLGWTARFVLTALVGKWLLQ